MASTYSSDLKLELMATGENAGTWGDKTNTNLNLVQQAVAGFEQVTLSSGGTINLVMSDGALSNARNLVIKFATATIAASTVCTIPDSIEKFYIFDATGLTNPTNLTIKTASGTGFTLDQAKIYAAYSDGTNLNEISLDTLGGTVAAANITGTIATAQIADDAVTFAKMQDTTTANRVLGAASAGTIGEVQVATDMIADDAVTADKLANTSVSAGSFTSASITVDAQGRITAASSGSAGAGGFVPVTITNSPGTFTASNSANSGLAYMSGGTGGGGGSTGVNNNGNGGPGGPGGFAAFSFPISAPFSKSFTIGGGGNAGSGTNSPNAPGGGSGSATSLTDVGSVNGGGGGGGGAQNNPGSTGSTGSGSSPQGNLISGINITILNDFENSGGGGGQSPRENNGNPGSGGNPGSIAIFENTGV
jgi:hypothetical protein